MATASKTDLVRRRMSGAGLSADAVDRYMQLMRQFLAARLTKARFETELHTLLPRDKLKVHNGIIRELLHRAQTKRDGAPEVPLPAAPADRAPPPARKAHAASRPTRADPPRKRPRDAADADPAPKRHDAGAPPDTAPAAAPPPPPPLRRPADKPRAPDAPPRAPDAPPRAPRPPPVGPPAARAGAARAAPPMLSGADVSTYNALPFFPVRPGGGMDVELFLRIRRRVRDHVVDHMGMAGVKDDAAALVMHALETHIKGILEAGVRQRAGRQASRPRAHFACGPVQGADLREAALRNAAPFGDEAAIDLERLSLLLF